MAFEVLTLATYGTLFVLWSTILILYLYNVRKVRALSLAVSVLLSILAIDAFRTTFESAYFGLYFSSVYDYLPRQLYEYLSKPEILILPKAFNLTAGLVIMFLLIKFWIPRVVAERREMLDAMSKSTRELELIRYSLQHISDSVYWVSPEGRVIDANQAACEYMGYTLDELRELHVYDFDPDFTREVWSKHWQQLKARGSRHVVTRHVTKSGKTVPVDIVANYLHYKGEDYNCAIVRDISKEVEKDNLIWKQANFDEMTGLPNRRLFTDRLNETLLTARRHNLSVAVMVIDIGRFKEINEVMGPEIADKTLVEISQKLNNTVRDSDTFARLSGDEFIAIIKNYNSSADIQLIADRVFDVMSEPQQLGELTMFLTASIGVTIYPNDALDGKRLIRNAYQAMSDAKDGGARNQLQFFAPSMHQRMKERARMVTEMREAIENDAFELHYQPIIDLQTGKVVKAEALIRWKHPEKGLIYPGEFIPLSEKTGLVIRIGDWVLKQTLNDLPRFREIDDSFSVAINTAPAHYKDLHCMSRWLENISDANLPGDAIVFEMTEHNLMPEHSEDIETTLNSLHDAGVRVALDDFGTGYSSLAYLKRYRIGFLKIDKNFVESITTEVQSHALCEAIIVMAHKLDMKVIAEGVETKEQMQVLVDIGCDYGQGYYFSRPVEVDKFLALIDSPLFAEY